ncbi:MAG: restriction endonuclease subunit S [Syntrophaceae bacterium]|nr:restriction endonuclease subunit S [Syntrophaceae bacterium]
MKKGWETKKLGEIAKVIYGYTEKASYSKIGPNFLRITDIQDGDVNWKTVPFCKINKVDLEKYKLTDGDIVFARTGATTGKSFLVRNPPPSVFASYLIKVHIADKKLLPEYVFLFFQTKTYWDIINAGVSGSAQGGFNATKLSRLSVPLPPLPEQKRIVAILDKAFAAIATAKANAEKNLQNARELFDSYLQGVFADPGDDWEEKKLGECFKLKSGNNLTSKMMIENGKFPVYGGNGIAGMYDNFNLSGSNIIVGRVGALCGNVRHIKDKIWLTDNAFKITDWKYDFDHAFLAYLLNFKNLRSYARQAAQPVISNSSLEDVLLQFPKSKEEQKSIVAKLDELLAETKKLEAIYLQKLADLEELKKSVLQKAFKGELN